MDLSIFLAQLLGVMLVVMAIVMWWRRAKLPELIGNFNNNSGLVFCVGLIELAAGLAIVLGHNFWLWDWPVIITIIGWLMIIEGLAWLSWPEATGRVAGRIMTRTGWMLALIIVTLIIGLGLIYIGFMPPAV